jgi:type IV fimbrial biogenesis protein FimT
VNFKRWTGFTLTEFVIVLAIAGLFISLAVPGYYSLIQNNKVVSMINNLSSGLNFARIESIRRGVRVSVCSAADASLTSCGNTSQWAQGWIVFIDSDNNNLVDASTNLVKINEALPAGTVVNASSNIISYDSSGFVTSGTFTMTITATGCTGNNARVLTVSTSGRLSIAKANCT